MSQPKFITNPSYDALHTAAVTIVREARTFAWLDYVMAPVRGGLMFGVVASHKLNVPLITIDYSSVKGKGGGEEHTNVFPVLDPSKNILLVDDLVDSGETMKEIVAHYVDLGHKVVTAVIHYKESSAFHPDLYYWRIPADSEFITYPYEVV